MPLDSNDGAEEFSDIAKLGDEAAAKINKANDASALDDIEREYLKKGGALDKLSKLIAKSSSENQKLYRPQIKKVENSIEKALKEKRKTLGSASGGKAGKPNVELIECPNCGYVNTVPAGRKLRFCVNCARPLKS
jgi:phenylalanyl-tRNA synthetase alpha subunit